MDIRSFFGNNKALKSSEAIANISQKSEVTNTIQNENVKNTLTLSSNKTTKTKKTTKSKSIEVSRSIVVQDDSEDDGAEKKSTVEGISEPPQVDAENKSNEAISNEKSQADEGVLLDAGGVLNKFSRISPGVRKRISWTIGEPVPYLALVEAFDDISKVLTILIHS